MDKKRKKVAPLKKATLETNLLQESCADLSEALMGNALDEIFGVDCADKVINCHSSTKDVVNCNEFINLDDLNCPSFPYKEKAINMIPKADRDGKYSSSTKDSCISNEFINLDDWKCPAFPSKEKNNWMQNMDFKGRKGSSKLSDSTTSVTPPQIAPSADRFGGKLLFTSKETEEDSVLGLRFSKRSISVNSLKELTSKLEYVNLASCLKTNEPKKHFTAGVVTDVALLRKSGCALTITDLAMEPYSIRVLLFGTASTAHSIVSIGNIVVLFSPRKGKPFNGQDSIIINDEKLFVVAGHSKDYGVCGARKKAGGTCKNVVNLNICRFCSYHALSQFKKKQVGKNMRSAAIGIGLLPDKCESITVNSTLWMGSNTRQSLINPGKRSAVQLQKDRDTLARLNGSFSRIISDKIPPNQEAHSLPIIDQKRKISATPAAFKSTDTFASAIHRKNQNENSATTGFFDYLPPPSQKQQASIAKKRALEFVKHSGGITPPEKKPRKIIMPETNGKELPQKKTQGISEEFISLMKELPSNPSLLKEAESAERDKRFDRLKVIEEIGEKLCKTHEVPVRAIRCMVCQKNFFKLPLHCANSSHKCKVVQATKRFFHCGLCKNRTSTLEKLPTTECGKCGKWAWQKAGVAAEKICSTAQKLSVRGLEEKFLGSVVTDANLSLLVPDDNK